MIIQKTEHQIELIRIACRIVGDTLSLMKSKVCVGITTKELDTIAHDFIVSKGATPSFLNFDGFPASICTSVNEVVVHGIPNNYALKEGDIIGIDIGACYKGYHGDAARTFCVGQVSKSIQNLVEVTKQCFYNGVEGLRAGDRVGKISSRVEALAKQHHYGIVKELVGHGVGANLHEDPQIPNYGHLDSGEYLPVSSVIAVEPMINLGRSDIRMLDDDWTIITADRKPSAHYENTILIKNDGIELLTLMEEER